MGDIELKQATALIERCMNLSDDGKRGMFAYLYWFVEMKDSPDTFEKILKDEEEADDKYKRKQREEKRKKWTK